ncbi:MAG TPA: hypothetical protein VGY77_11335 [Gemmataceae bacterium]|nr:hypothetical protein [Gemmataceae bacterium]
MFPRHSAVFVVVGLSALIQPARGQSIPGKKLSNAPNPKILTEVPAGPDNPVPVRHLDGSNQDDWSVAETANFRVFHRRSRTLGDKAARLVERTRAGLLRKWFGGDPKNWVEPCDVYLHVTREDYRRTTGAPAYSPGHSSFSWTGRGVMHRRIDLHCDEPNLLSGILLHETAHGVMAGQFGQRQVPRWADEGMAVLAEPRDTVHHHLRNLPDFRRDGRLFGLRELMEMSQYPPAERIPAFYAQSISLVQFLSDEKGPHVFTRFIGEGMDKGYEKALKDCYGWDFAELGNRWRRYAFGQEKGG